VTSKPPLLNGGDQGGGAQKTNQGKLSHSSQALPVYSDEELGGRVRPVKGRGPWAMIQPSRVARRAERTRSWV